MRSFLRFILFAVLLSLFSLEILGQETVSLGGYTFVPPANVKLRGIPQLGDCTGGSYNVLVQFSELPSAQTIESLRLQGVWLTPYVEGMLTLYNSQRNMRKPCRSLQSMESVQLFLLNLNGSSPLPCKQKISSPIMLELLNNV